MNTNNHGNQYPNQAERDDLQANPVFRYHTRWGKYNQDLHSLQFLQSRYFHFFVIPRNLLSFSGSGKYR